MNAFAEFAAEPSEAGIQTLVPGVAPISARERLEARMTAPLAPVRPQKPADLGLFDLAARDQLELFGTSGRDTDTFSNSKDSQPGDRPGGEGAAPPTGACDRSHAPQERTEPVDSSKGDDQCNSSTSR